MTFFFQIAVLQDLKLLKRSGMILELLVRTSRSRRESLRISANRELCIHVHTNAVKTKISHSRPG